MRKRTRTLFGLGDADEVEQLDGAGPGRPARGVAVVHLDGLGDLVADGVDGRQRRHRVLEHRADGLTADTGHPLVGEPEQLVAVQPHRSGHLGVLRQQPDDGHRAGRLARTGLADESDDFARVDVVVHPAHGRDPLGFGGEGDREIAYLQETHLRLPRNGGRSDRARHVARRR